MTETFFSNLINRPHILVFLPNIIIYDIRISVSSAWGSKFFVIERYNMQAFPRTKKNQVCEFFNIKRIIKKRSIIKKKPETKMINLE